MANGDGTQPLETPSGVGPPTPGVAQLAQFIKMMQAQQQQRQPGQVFPGMPGASLAAPTLPGQPPVGGQPPVPGAMPSSQAPRAPMQPPAPQPSMTAASYGGPATRPGGITPPGYDTGFSFPDKGARNMAVASSAIKSLQEAVTQVKQQRWTQEAAKTEQVASGYVTLLQKADEETDPQKKQQLLQLAEQMKSDKAVAKLLEKAQKDPMSGAAIGLQRAMQTAQAKSQQSAQLEGMKAQAAKAYADAQKLQADAQEAQARAAKAKQETENITPEGLKRQHEMDLEKTKAVQDAMTLRTQETVKGAMDRNKNTVDAMRDIAKARVSAMERIAGIKKDDKVVDYFDKAYKNIQSSVNNLTTEHKALQDHIDKQTSGANALMWWKSADVKTTQNKIAANEARVAQLKKLQDEVDKRRAMALGMGALPPDPSPPDEDTPTGDEGTENNPTVIK